MLHDIDKGLTAKTQKHMTKEKYIEENLTAEAQRR